MHVQGSMRFYTEVRGGGGDGPLLGPKFNGLLLLIEFIDS